MPLSQTGQSIRFSAFYTASGLGATGLTVTVDVYRDGSEIVTAGSAVEAGDGLYSYTLAGGSTGTAGDYVAIFKTASTTVDQRHVASYWSVGRPWVQTIVSNLDATISSIATAVAAIPTAVWDRLTSALTTVGSIGKLLVDRIDAEVSSRMASADYTAPPSAADVADAVWDEALSGHQVAGSAGEALSDAGANTNLTAAEVWAHSSRTLTQSAASVAAVMAGSDISIRRGDTVTITLTGLGSLVGRSKLYWTVKSATGLADSAATLQVEETAGAVRLNGAAATANQATLVVDDADAGDITITLLPALTAQLAPLVALRYDVQMVRDDGTVVATLTEASVTITADVTRATS